MNTIKCVVVGDGAIGKTSLLIRYTTKKFPKDYIPTIFENYSANVQRDGKTYILSLWDTAGQEEYDKIRPLSYREADVVIICFSLESQISLDNVRTKWFPEVKQHCPKAFILLAGTKKDLRDDLRKESSEGSNDCGVPYSSGNKMSKDINAVCYIECSALTQVGVDHVFDEALRVGLRAAKKRKFKSSCIIN